MSLDTPSSRSAQRRFDPAVEAALNLLCTRFPKVFQRYEARRRPLKIGIHLDLLAALDGAVDPDELSRALAAYTANKVYRSRLLRGAWRYDLDGAPAGEVSAAHAHRRPVPKPKAPSPPPRRSSLADLREAARRRKAEGAA
jgi:sRNA-binding protein